MAKEKEEKHSCSGSWVLNGALFQNTQKGNENKHLSLGGWGVGVQLFAKELCKIRSLLGRTHEHSVFSIELEMQ